MFPSFVVFVLLIYAIFNVLVYLQGCTANKKAVQTISAIAIANYVWARSINFKRMIIGMDFCCFTPGSSFAYPLKFCPNKNGNDPYGSLLGSSLKADFKA